MTRIRCQRLRLFERLGWDILHKNVVVLFVLKTCRMTEFVYEADSKELIV